MGGEAAASGTHYSVANDEASTTIDSLIACLTCQCRQLESSENIYEANCWVLIGFRKLFKQEMTFLTLCGNLKIFRLLTVWQENLRF